MSSRQTSIIDQIEHSNRQEKQAIHDVGSIFTKAHITPSTAHQGKRAGMDANREKGAKTSHDVHKGTMTSWNTYETYRAACVPLVVFARAVEGIRMPLQITPDAVGKYLNMVVDCEIKESTFMKNCAAIEKFCDCINALTGEKKDFHSVISSIRTEVRQDAALAKPDNAPRAYHDASAIIRNLPDNMQIAAELQATCGLRISDAVYIKPEQWNGETLTCNSKNGQLITVTPNAALAERITAVINENGHYGVSKNAYDYQLAKACAAAGETFSGSHGFRHYYAQTRMSELTCSGMKYRDALQVVSEEMGHHRPDITEVYLR